MDMHEIDKVVILIFAGMGLAYILKNIIDDVQEGLDEMKKHHKYKSKNKQEDEQK